MNSCNLNKSFSKWLTICIFFSVGSATAQNTINPAGGGFVALIPNGDVDSNNNFPLGERVNGLAENAPIWQTATNYVATGGTGELQIRQDLDTDIYVENSTQSTGNTVNDEVVNIVATTSRVRLFFDTGTQFFNNGLANAATINANRIEIYDGYFDSFSRNNSFGEHALSLSGSYAYLKDTTILGADVIQNYVNGTSAGHGLILNSVETVVLDFTDNRNINEIVGGDGEIEENAANNSDGDVDDFIASTTGGDGIQASSSNIYATNLFTEGGNAGSARFNIERVLSDGPEYEFGVVAYGGNGISATGSNIHIEKGEIKGTDGGSFRFQSEDGLQWDLGYVASGGNGIDGGTGNGTLNYVTVSGGNAGSLTLPQASSGGHLMFLSGGSAYTGNMNGGSISNSSFTGGTGVEYLTFTAGSTIVNMNGGDGLGATGSVNVVNNYLTSGNAGTAHIITTGTAANTITGNGGDAYTGSGILENNFAQGGDGGLFSMSGTNQTDVVVNGGVAAQTTGDTDINSGSFYGGNGGRASVATGSVSADGGDALLHTSDELNVYGGTFKGGSGGSADAETGTNTSARAGLGARVTTGGHANFYGGTFSSGQDGNASSAAQRTYSQYAGWLDGAGVVLIASNATFNGDLLVNNTTELSIEGGTIRGDVRFEGGTTGFKLTTDTAIQGMLIQESGTVTADLSTTADGAAYENLLIQSGSFTFANQQLITDQNARFMLLGTNSQLTAQQGATLSAGTAIQAGYGQITSGSDLIVENGSSIYLNFNGTTNGTLDVTGNLDLSANGTVRMSGAATQSSGHLYFGQASSISSPENIETSMGWLTQSAFSNDSNRLRVDYSYHSLTNSASDFASLSEAQLLNIDNALSNSNSPYFARINALGHDAGNSLIRYDESQAPDIADAALDNQNYIHRQINARTMEMRARGGFAHNQTRSHLPAPTGVAGPQSAEESLTKGWVRGYGAFGSRDESTHYAAYDTTHFGTVIGIDRQFGSLLLGIAGGYSSLELDADTTYTAEADAYHGSLYASWGSRESFLDLAIARAQHDVKAQNLLTADNFDAESTSFYIGAGREWKLNERLTWTPILAYQRTDYDQDGYLHNGILPKQMRAYDSSSDLISLGATIASARQYEWFNRHLAMIPEFRFRWLHELSPELEALAFDYVGANESSFVSLRTREENLFEIGLGIDFWSWHFYATKFEFDYDYLLGEEYTEHTFSGKMTFQF